MKAQDVMSANPTCVTPDAAVRDVAQLMKRDNVGVIPVIESTSSHQLVGVVTDRDIAIRVIGEGKDSSTPVGEIMTTNVRTHLAGDPLEKIMSTMAGEQLRRVLIVDDRGSLIGIVSQADIVLEAGNEQKAAVTIEKISTPGTKGRT